MLQENAEIIRRFGLDGKCGERGKKGGKEKEVEMSCESRLSGRIEMLVLI